jgi:hypothetical protein
MRQDLRKSMEKVDATLQFFDQAGWHRQFRQAAARCPSR